MDDRFLSRGKLKADNFPHKKGDWVFGCFVDFECGDRNIPCIYGFGEIIPETLGGCTGLTDKNDKLIFEGDIIRYTTKEYSDIYIVKWDIMAAHFAVYGLGLGDKIPLGDFTFYDPQKCEVIGNIHDNPELLESEVAQSDP